MLSGKFASIGLWEKVSDTDIKQAEGVLEKLGIMKPVSYTHLDVYKRQILSESDGAE